MGEIIREPQLTHVINEITNRGMDPVAMLEATEEGVRWRGESPAPTTELSDRDRGILDLDVVGYDFVQVVVSRLDPVNDSYERRTLKTRHLPIEAVKNYLKGVRDETHHYL